MTKGEVMIYAAAYGAAYAAMGNEITAATKAWEAVVDARQYTEVALEVDPEKKDETPPDATAKRLEQVLDFDA